MLGVRADRNHRNVVRRHIRHVVRHMVEIIIKPSVLELGKQLLEHSDAAAADCVEMVVEFQRLLIRFHPFQRFAGRVSLGGQNLAA